MIARKLDRASLQKAYRWFETDGESTEVGSEHSVEMFLITLGGQNFTISRLLRIAKNLLRPPKANTSEISDLVHTYHGCAKQAPRGRGPEELTGL